MSPYNIGDTDEWGYILMDRWGPTELWETTKGYYVVCFYATDEHVLYAVRKNRKDAEAIFYSVHNILLKGVWEMADTLGWSEKKLFNSYESLIEISEKFKEISQSLDQKNWVTFNLVRDKGVVLSEIASMINIPMAIAESAENARRCIIKWDSDWEKVRDCIAGKIDP